MATETDKRVGPGIHVSVRHSGEGELAGRHVGFAALVAPRIAVLPATEEPIDGSGSYWILGGPEEIDESTVFTARIDAAVPVTAGDDTPALVVLTLGPSLVEPCEPSEAWLEAAARAWASRSGLPGEDGTEMICFKSFFGKCPGRRNQGCCHA